MKKLYLLVSLLVVSSIIFCSCIFRAPQTQSHQVNAGSLVSYPVIILDAGHGGFDGGATDKEGNPEKDINLSICLYLREYLQLMGFTTVLTRESDTSLEDSSAKTIRQKKTSDLHNRMKLMEETKNCIFISIHQNIYSIEKYSGMQVFYSPQLSESSSMLAQSIQENTVNLLQKNNTRQIKECGTSVYLIYNACAPACLVECGFLSNTEEAKKLNTKGYQMQLAFTIALGIQEFLYRG